MDETPEARWLRIILESEGPLSKKLTKDELEKLVDDWCAQAALEERVALNKDLLRRLLRDWLNNHSPFR